MLSQIYISNRSESNAVACYMASTTLIKDVQVLSKEIFSNHQSLDQNDQVILYNKCIEVIRRGVMYYYNTFREKIDDPAFCRELLAESREFLNSMQESSFDKSLRVYMTEMDFFTWFPLRFSQLPKGGKKRVTTKDYPLVPRYPTHILDFMSKCISN